MYVCIYDSNKLLYCPPPAAGWEQLGQENRPLLRAYYTVKHAIEKPNDIEASIQEFNNHYLDSILRICHFAQSSFGFCNINT